MTQSLKKLVDMADSDTPKGVIIPPTWVGVYQWMIGRLGVGIIFLGAAYFFYNDGKNENRKVIEDLRQQNRRFYETTQETNQRILSVSERFITVQSEFKGVIENNTKSQYDIQRVLETHARILNSLERQINQR